MGEVRRPTYTVKVTDPDTGEVRREKRVSKVWWIRYYRNGKRHEESSESTKKGDAVRLLRQREGDIARGIPVGAEAGQLRFSEAAGNVVRDYELNGRKTTSDVEARIRLHLGPWFGDRRMSSITSEDVTEYSIHRQEEGAANATINRELAVLKRAFRLAERGGKLVHLPHIPMLKERNVRTGFFEQAEFEAVRANLPRYLQGIVTVAYYTGWRVPSEILPLEWDQVDRGEKIVRLEPGSTKNDQGRILPYELLPELVEVFEGAWERHQEMREEGKNVPWVFSRNGERIHSFYKAWGSACEEAGVRGRIPHDLRRTAVRNLVRAGVPETVAMNVTGHKTRAVFDRYDITSPDDIAQALGAVRNATGKEKGKRSGLEGSSGST